MRAVFASSLLEAWVSVATKCLGPATREAVPVRSAVRGTWDEPVGAPPKGDVHFEFSGEGFAGYAAVVPALLRRLELGLLEHPEHVGWHDITFVDVRKLEDVE